jgi:hypothetical protein
MRRLDHLDLRPRVRKRLARRMNRCRPTSPLVRLNKSRNRPVSLPQSTHCPRVPQSRFWTDGTANRPRRRPARPSVLDDPRYDCWMRRWTVLVTSLVIMGLGTGLVLGKALASPGRVESTTTATTVATTTCAPILPFGTLCKTVVRR